MEIRIRKQGSNTAVLISFDTNIQKFESPYERNKFFAELHGRKQIVVKQGKRYEYRREGILDEIPNLRVDDSIFIIMQEHMKMMERFFGGWEDKVMFRSFPVLLNNRDMRELEESNEKEVLE